MSAITCPNQSCGYVVQSTDQKFCPKCGSFLPLADQPDAADPFVGQTILGGKYRIVSVIGEGGMGKVYLAEQKMGTATRKVAIKTLQPEFANDPQIIARFYRETQTVIELEHPNTIKFYDFGELPMPDGKKFLFIAMEYIQGETLAHVLARGPIDVARAERILAQVCGSLHEAHEKGIVHRDLKPDNIFLTQKGARGDFVKVLDFGIAKRSEAADDKEAKLTKQGMVLGTPPYMSPEQFTGQALDPRSDVYALGVIAYEMLTGTLPFVAATPWEWATKHLTMPPTPLEQQPGGASIPQRHRDAIMKALRKNRDERQKNVVEFLQDFAGSAVGAVDWTSATNFTNATGAVAPSNHAPLSPVLPPTAGFQPNNTAPGSVGAAATGGAMAMSPTPNPFAAPAIGGAAAVGAFGTPAATAPFGSVGGAPMSAGGAFGAPMSAGGGGFAPAPSNAGFAAVPPQVPPGSAGSNPSFLQPPTAAGAVSPTVGAGYGEQPTTQPKPKSKAVWIVVVLLGVVMLIGGGISYVMFRDHDDDEPSSHTAQDQQQNQQLVQNTQNQGSVGMSNPALVPPNQGQQPIPSNTGTSIEPQVPPIPSNDPNPQPPDTTSSTQDPPPPNTNSNSFNPQYTQSSVVAEGLAALASDNFAGAIRAMQQASAAGDSSGAARLRAAIRARGRRQIDNLILADRCAAAQALYRQLRAAGAAPNAADSFGDSCRAP